jgi:hypothetical protein
MSKTLSLNTLAALSLGLVSSLASAAHAGSKAVNNVYVDAASRVAQGDVGQARNSADTRQVIGCHVQSYRNASGEFEQASCSATDAAGNSYSCYATEAALVRSARAINGDSFVFFFGDAAGKCVNISVGLSSYYQPKQP